MKKILIVEDEASISDYLSQELTFEGYEVFLAIDGLVALDIFNQEKENLDIVLLDWMLPKMDGLGVLRRMKKNAPQIPVIFLTARDYVGDKVAGLDAGADDYLTKPFDIEELMARVRVVFRKQGIPQYFSCQEVILDTLAHQVRVAGKNVELTQREYALLLYLFEHQGMALSRDNILDDVWGMNFAGQTNTVDTYVRYLREKLGVPIIETVRGVGYRLLNKE